MKFYDYAVVLTEEKVGVNLQFIIMFGVYGYAF